MVNQDGPACQDTRVGFPCCLRLLRARCRVREAARKVISANKLAVMHACGEELAQSGIVEASLNVDDRAPDFPLPSEIGKTGAVR